MPPSLKHQGLAKLIGECPELWPTLLRRTLGIELPERLERVQLPETIRELPFPEHAADVVVGLRSHRGRGLEEAFPHEIQLRPDPDKRWSWPIHISGLRTRLECPTTLIVLATNERTARWAAKPIDLGRGRMILHPLVIGPRQIPMEIDLVDAKANPEFATLAVMIHGKKAGSKRLGRVAYEAVLDVLDRSSKRGTLLLELIAASLHAKTLREIEEEMELDTDICFTKIGRHKFAEGRTRGREEGLLAGREEGLLAGREEGLLAGREEGLLAGRRLAIGLVLESRGLSLTAAQRRRIERCTSDRQLEAWLQRAALVDRASELFKTQAKKTPAESGRRSSVVS